MLQCVHCLAFLDLRVKMRIGNLECYSFVYRNVFVWLTGSASANMYGLDTVPSNWLAEKLGKLLSAPSHKWGNGTPFSSEITNNKSIGSLISLEEEPWHRSLLSQVQSLEL